MGEKHEGLAYPLKNPPTRFIEHDRQGNGENSSEHKKKEIEVQGIPDNRGRRIALKEKLKILKPIEGAAKHSQAIIKTFKGNYYIGI
jgi:hypothetical protein